MKIHNTRLSEVSTDRRYEITESADASYNASDPLAEILEAIDNLQDGEILRIVPAQRGGESNG